MGKAYLNFAPVTEGGGANTGDDHDDQNDPSFPPSPQASLSPWLGLLGNPSEGGWGRRESSEQETVPWGSGLG